ncbi:MAG: hypothetical protein PHI79_06370 [Sulfurovaceae bacterium]|nr:hypothetical protein [Sulfurovaceae bacterium]MDD5549202.1 hypothetical protein [Sulfurovaceae bacterium]
MIYKNYIFRMCQKILKSKDEFIVKLGYCNDIKISTPCATIPFETIWENESFRNKILAFLKLKWNPEQDLLEKIAKDIFIEEIFGEPEDLAEGLFDLMNWHFSQDWESDNLTEIDIEKAKALEAMTSLTNKRYWELDSLNLNLKLVLKAPLVCSLICPVVAKVPIISIRYYIHIHIRYAFNSIRRSKHKYSDEIIAYMYEILVLQQKTAIAFHTLIKLIVNLDTKVSILHKNDIDAIMNIDIIVTNLKSSIEKMIVLVGYIYHIANLEDKKTHKAKLQALNNQIPDLVKRQWYYQFFEKFISSDQINLLNQYRTGQLHKKGISIFQPHNYFGKDSVQSLSKIFYELHDQHSKNSAIMIAASALLTDELVKLDKPSFNVTDIPCDKINNIIYGETFGSG